jgi:hypothetical protein
VLEQDKTAFNKLISEKMALLKKAKDREAALGKDLGKTGSGMVVRTVEKIFERHCIEKPYYHGGKYNGKAMVNYLTNSGKIFDAIQEALLAIDQQERGCDDGEIEEFMMKYKNVLGVWDGVFSMARIPSYRFHEEDMLKLKEFISDGMKLWRGLKLSVSPKPHAIEDHLCDQIQIFSGIGDLTEDFIEQSHQTGIRHHKRSGNMKDHNKVAKWHVGWEEKENNPAVIQKMKEVKMKSSRVKRRISEGGECSLVEISKREEKKNRIDEEKRNVRMGAFATTKESQETYCKSGNERNKDDFIKKMYKARDRITALCRGRIVRKIRIIMKKASYVITTQCRVKLARKLRIKMQCQP